MNFPQSLLSGLIFETRKIAYLQGFFSWLYLYLVNENKGQEQEK
nr:MAG TPA: hypothetical protein [Caudoviricetes sp.]